MVPKDFPGQTPTVWYTASGACESTRNTPEPAAQGCSWPAPTTTLPPPKLPPLPLHMPFSLKDLLSEGVLGLAGDEGSATDRAIEVDGMFSYEDTLEGEWAALCHSHPWLIPLTFRDSIKKELDYVVGKGIMVPVGDDPLSWCHPLVVRCILPPTSLSCTAHPSPTPFTSIRKVYLKAGYYTTVEPSTVTSRSHWCIRISY